jgi:hypothetical protein
LRDGRGIALALERYAQAVAKIPVADTVDLRMRLILFFSSPP